MINEISASYGVTDGAQGSVVATLGRRFRVPYKPCIPQDLLTHKALGWLILTISLTGSKTSSETNLWARLWRGFYFEVFEVRRPIQH